MIFAKDLLLKGLAGLAVCAGAVGLGVHYNGGFSSLFGSSEVKITRVEDIGLTTSEACKLPEVGATTSCTLSTDNINNIKFEGKSATQNPALTGTGTLQISIPRSNEKDIFPHGYKVTITATGSDITVTRDTPLGNIVLKANQATDFKIKQKEDGTFSLEKAWTEDLLAKKLGLGNKDAEGKWSLDGKTIKVKHNALETKTSNSGQTGKIKAVENAAYNQGFKFVIEDGNIALTNGAVGTSITKLEQFETYEIKEEESHGWVLVRKTKAIDEIKTLLGLPTDCTEISGETVCESLDQAKLKAINFEGKGNGEVTITDASNSPTIKLKISKTTDANREKFPHGHKFVLESNKNISIPKTGSTSITIKKGTNTEFKIKKGEGENSWTLEKAWTVEDLAAKVKLTGCTAVDNATKECSFGDSISVYNDANNKVVDATFAVGSTGKKITYELDQEDHNQGIKFTVSEDISISGTSASGITAPTQICNTAGTGTPSYEIKEIGGVWYLAKKSTAGG